MKYHYYLGLQLPSDIRKQIQAVQHDLFDPIESIEPLEPHITLLPPPAVEDIAPESLAFRARETAHSSWPLHIHLADTMTFRGHAVAIRVESPGLDKLQQKLVDLLPFETDVRYFPNPRFTPHVTLVQALHGHTLPSKLITRYKDEVAAMLPVSFEARHLTLFEWLSPRKYQAKVLLD